MLLSNLDLLATAQGGVARLRELILTLAVRGKLVPQDPTDEPASVLLKKIRVDKDRLIAEGRIKRDKPLAGIAEDKRPCHLPKGWTWARLTELGEFCGGKTPSTQRATFWDGDIPWITPKDMKQLRLSSSEDKVTQLAVNDGLILVPPHSVLIVVRSGILRRAVPTAVNEVATTINQDLKALVLPRPEIATYVQLLIRGFESFILQNLTKIGTTVESIQFDAFAAQPFPVPPLAEQSRIVTRVEELMRLCDALEAKGQLEAAQHAQLVSTLLGTLLDSPTPTILAENWQRVATHFDLLLDRPQAVDALEQTILQLAVRGLLVPQDPTDEPASALLKKIRAEKDKLIAEGKIKRDKPLLPIAEEEQPFALPQGWEWVRLNDLIRIGSGDGLTAAQMAPGGTIPVYGGNGVNGHHDKANVDEPTLVIGRVGYYCGSVHITPAKAWVTDNAFITRYPKACLDMAWLYWLLVGTNLKENDSATAQPVISGRKLYPIVVALPPLAEQSRIVTRVASLRRLCADLRQRLAASQSTQAHLAEALVQKVQR